MNLKNKELAYAEIMHFFRYNFRSEWAPDSIFNNKSRLWIKVFHDLIDQGFIMRRKKHPGYEYRWTGVWPDKY